MLSSSGSDFYEERKCDLYMRVTFRTSFSQELRIVGNIPELGSWNIVCSRALETDANSYPVWVNKFPLKLARGKREKKKLIMKHFERKKIKIATFFYKRKRNYRFY